MSDVSDFLLVPGLTAELRGCDRKRFSSAALKKKKEEDPFTRGGRAGFHCKIVLMNGSQRCELHNRALFWWVGWARSACRVAVAILVKSDSARNFEDLPPTQRCIDSVYIRRGAIGSASAQQLLKKKGGRSFHPGRAGGVSLQDCALHRQIVSVFEARCLRFPPHHHRSILISPSHRITWI